MNLILDIQVGAPVTDFSRTKKLANLEDRVIIGVVKIELLLVCTNETKVGGDRQSVIWPIGESCTRLGNRRVGGKLLKSFGFSVGEVIG